MKVKKREVRMKGMKNQDVDFDYEQEDPAANADAVANDEGDDQMFFGWDRVCKEFEET